jgi:hypothetical protein
MSTKKSANGKTEGVVKQAFLYYDLRVVLANGQREWRSQPHLILKRTPKYVYVEPFPYHPDEGVGQWDDLLIERIRLNRASLERDGFAFISFTDADLYGFEEPLFFTTPHKDRVVGAGGVQDCFALLELTPPTTVEAVKRAYRRLAKQHHPDRGGAASQFLALQMAYRQALETLDV